MASITGRVIPQSELILNEDGTMFHLHLLSDHLKPNVILVGDPARVAMIAKYLDKIEAQGSNREYLWVSGYIGSKGVLVLSTGIGVGNIDIVMTELDALANINLESRTLKEQHSALNIIRIGTSGAVQDDICLGDAIVASQTIGIDSVPRLYRGLNDVCNSELSEKFASFMSWPKELSTPYAIDSAPELVSKFDSFARRGITLTSPAFYGGQGRHIKLEPTIAEFTSKLAKFRGSNGEKITNIEMEGATINAMAKMLGHRACTVCMAIAQRSAKDMKTSYHDAMNCMIEKIISNL